jgi:hypothetical protein
VEKSSQIGQKLPRARLGKGSSSWRDEEEEWGGGLGQGERRMENRRCTPVPVHNQSRYKCVHICTGSWL